MFARIFFSVLVGFLAPVCGVLAFAEPQGVQSFIFTQDNLPKDLLLVKERGCLRIGMFCQDRTPFLQIDEDGQYHGLEWEMACDIARRLGVKVEVVQASSYEEAVNCVANKSCDIAISKLSLTMARAQKALYSKCYMVMHKTLLVNRTMLRKLNKNSDCSIIELAKHKDFKLGVLKGSAYEAFARNVFGPINLVRYSNLLTQGMPLLLDGAITAIFSDELEAHSMLKAIPGATFKLLMIKLVDQEDRLFILVNPDHQHLLHFINCYLEAFYHTMRAENIVKNPQYFQIETNVLSNLKKQWLENQALVHLKKNDLHAQS